MRSAEKGFAAKLRRLAAVVAGIFIGQAILYGPSLVGKKILLPLDILELPKFYIPGTSETDAPQPHNRVLTDLVLLGEPKRRAVAAELHSGRVPLWNPSQYAGAPALFPIFSPFNLLLAAFESPRIIPWVQVLLALTAGTGTYVFCRRVLRLSFWPSAIAAWCYPLTGFFVLWQGFGVPVPVVWFPWILFLIHKTVRRPSSLGGFGLAVVTWQILVSGALDVSGQVLLASGLFAVWCYFTTYRKRWFTRRALGAGVALSLGWALGFGLAAPYILPTIEYTHTGVRMIRRGAGEEDRPPIGLAVLPEIVCPFLYGSTERGSFPIFPKGQTNFLEGASATYAGLMATLFLAPLAWCSRRHRSINLFWCVLGFFALSWDLNVPGLVSLLRMPLLNMMSHNRLVFAASFAIVALSATGLDLLLRDRARWRQWFAVPVLLLVAIGLWSFYRTLSLPEPVDTVIEHGLRHGSHFGPIHDLSQLAEIKAWFVGTNAWCACLCCLSLAGWLLLSLGKSKQTKWASFFGALLVADLLCFGYGRATQCEPSLYYPKIPMLEEIAKSAPGRIIGVGCLPSELAGMCGLDDVRGYDAIDPARLMELMSFAAEPGYTTSSYATTQWFQPKMSCPTPDTARLSPILDMFGVRYVILRGSPPANLHPVFRGNDYWCLTNPSALPRVFVPKRVETVPDASARLKALSSGQFNPREVAYVESAVALPETCRGSAKILNAIPTRITVSLQMETPGLLVLADLWDIGWKAYLDNRQTPILRANHAIRGVVVPQGNSTVEFRYESSSLARGYLLAALSASILGGWFVSQVFSMREKAKRILS